MNMWDLVQNGDSKVIIPLRSRAIHLDSPSILIYGKTNRKPNKINSSLYSLNKTFWNYIWWKLKEIHHHGPWYVLIKYRTLISNYILKNKNYM